MRVALYARCSTADQSVDLQLDELRTYAANRGFDVVQTYCDNGVSGSKTSRPALDQLLADAHRRKFDAVLVWKLDRLGRSLGHLIRMVDQLGSLGVDLVSFRDTGMDTTGPTGTLIFHVLASVAEFERDLIRERTRAGMAAAKRRGKHIGRPGVVISSAEAEELVGSGCSIAETARRLGVPRTSLRRALAKGSLKSATAST